MMDMDIGSLPVDGQGIDWPEFSQKETA